VLGSYDPLKHEFIADMPAIKALINQGAQPSERVAKLLFASTKDDFYKTFYKEITRKGTTKKEKKDM
jgi:ribosomal protein S16